jgi:hypothetical protein
VRSISEGGYSLLLEYYGGVSTLELPVGFWVQCSGLVSISWGAHQPRALLLHLD